MKMLLDKQTGELFSNGKLAWQYAVDNYDFADDTNTVSFEELFEVVEV